MSDRLSVVCLMDDCRFSLCDDFHEFCFVAEVSWLYLEFCDFLGLVVLV